MILNYCWFGNIREFDNVIVFVVVFCEDGFIEVEDLFDWFICFVFVFNNVDDVEDRCEEVDLCVVFVVCKGNVLEVVRWFGIDCIILYCCMCWFGIDWLY